MSKWRENVREGRKTNSEVIGEDEEKIDNAGGWDNASCLGSDQNGGCGGGSIGCLPLWHGVRQE